jgi:hypothetical protein
MEKKQVNDKIVCCLKIFDSYNEEYSIDCDLWMKNLVIECKNIYLFKFMTIQYNYGLKISNNELSLISKIGEFTGDIPSAFKNLSGAGICNSQLKDFMETNN